MSTSTENIYTSSVNEHGKESVSEHSIYIYKEEEEKCQRAQILGITSIERNGREKCQTSTDRGGTLEEVKTSTFGGWLKERMMPIGYGGVG